MTLNQCRLDTEHKLQTIYPQGESQWMTRIIFEKIKGYSLVDLAIKADEPVSDFIKQKIGCVVDRLLKYEPIQYIFEEAQFYGLTLKVTPATLIPRPETEELVSMIIKDAEGRSDLRVLDICTGSGCIAIALARNLRFPSVEATDISKDALAIAQENISNTRTSVMLRCEDALSMSASAVSSYDIIVSNPPYIAAKERALMSPNVINHEPSIALFVPDEDPLRFYHAICRFAEKSLLANGRLYFEINPIYAQPLANEMTEYGWTEVELHRDMQKQIRFLSATRPDK